MSAQPFSIASREDRLAGVVISVDGAVPVGQAEVAGILGTLPKAELHVHLEGSIRLDTLLDLARVQRVALASRNPEVLAKTLRLGEPFEDLAAHLDVFETTVSVLQSAPALRRVAHEIVEDAARDQVHHLELRLCPDLHRDGGLTQDEVLSAVLAGLTEGERRFAVSFGVIITAMRERPPAESQRLSKLAGMWSERGVVGFDLAGLEPEVAATVHRDALRMAQLEGLGTTIHAGEAAGPDSVAEALELGADRIGHGTRSREDPGLAAECAKRAIPFEMCPSSNVQTGAVGEIADHPALDYLRAGIAVSIHTDNRLVSQTNVTRELVLLWRHGAMTWPEAVALCRNSLESAFLPEGRRRQLCSRLDTVVQRLEGSGFQGFASAVL